jgi:hypothetical protein
VRIHTDQPASDWARSLGAMAVTAGQNIAFREGAFAPDNTDGQRGAGRHQKIASGCAGAPVAPRRRIGAAVNRNS